MSLQILENSGTFYLYGNLNASTSRAFIIHFEHIIERFKNVTINIDKVEKMDSNGVAAFKRLLTNALRKHKKFFVIGNGSKDIYYEFNKERLAS